MNKKTFIELFIQAREESIGSNSNSQTDEDDVYDTYIDLVKQMSDSNTARTHMERMSEMTNAVRQDQAATVAASKIAVAAMKPPGGNANGRE